MVPPPSPAVLWIVSVCEENPDRKRNTISRLTLSIAQVLGTDEMRRNFKLGSTDTKVDFCDVARKEFRE